MLIPVILSGGAGSRLWPLSRPECPKQFLALSGQSQASLLQETLLRLDGLPDTAPPVMLCNEAHRFLVAEQARAIGVEPTAILLEPVGRNTAPAVAMAALYAREHDPDALLLVLPSDHAIADPDAFTDAVQRACRAAQAGYLVTFGIPPQAPKTGYGYIQRGTALCEQDPGLPEGLYEVSRFVEKPDKATAREFIQTGDFFWNSGMFVFSADRYLEELARFQPAMLAACVEALGRAQRDADFIRLDGEALHACPSGSIDYALMEKTSQAAMIPVEMGWSDVGSWQALWEMGLKDAQGNVLMRDGAGLTLLENVSECLLYAHTPGKTFAALGVSNLIVVETPQALLIAHRSQEQAVRQLAHAASRAAANNPQEVAHGGAS